MFRKIIRLINGLVTAAVACALLVCALYAGYALWDNQQIYNAAENVRADMLRLKPVEEEGEEIPTLEERFAQMQEINPDVCGWITMDNTRVDYPLLMGKDNSIYLNTNVFGEFSLAGSIFLDSRCDKEFEHPYMLIHGHHMAQGGMFGDLDLYKNEAFFNKYRTGTLMLPKGTYTLDIFAYLLLDARDDYIFEPYQWETGVTELLAYVQDHAVFLRQEIMDELVASAADTEAMLLPIVTLATCSSEFTDARTIIMTVMREKTNE